MTEKQKRRPPFEAQGKRSAAITKSGALALLASRAEARPLHLLDCRVRLGGVDGTDGEGIKAASGSQKLETRNGAMRHSPGTTAIDLVLKSECLRSDFSTIVGCNTLILSRASGAASHIVELARLSAASETLRSARGRLQVPIIHSVLLADARLTFRARRLP